MTKQPAPTQLADVAPAIPMAGAKSADSYTYSVPAGMAATIAAGSQVTIPLGRQTVAGTVLTLHRRSVPYPTKPLTLRNNPPLTHGQMALARWLSTTLRGSLGYTLRLFFGPSGPSPIAPVKKGATGDLLPVPAPALPSLLIEKNDERRYRAIEEFLQPAVSAGAQALILVPELRFVEPLRAYLAQKCAAVSIYHSAMAPKALAAVWHRVYRGEPAIVIGTQKALFLPWRRLARAVLEEEYLDTHKLWDQYPRLDNRDVLPQLAALHGAQLLYSGSWPALTLADSRERRRNHPVRLAPKVVPLSFDDRRQGRLLPPDAVLHLKEAGKKHQRTLILHNQRGSWRAAVCEKCHQALRCPDCDSTVFVTGRKTAQRVQCRQCAYSAPLPKACPTCRSPKLRVFGPGTARIASIIQQLAPRARVLEVTAGSAVDSEQLAAADIVVGTTAVWRYTREAAFDRALWLFPESTLLYPDYRSHERALTMLAQLQKTLPARGRVLLVTRYKDLIEQSLAKPADKLVTALLRERARFHYPPYADLIRLTIHARSESAALVRGREIRSHIDAKLPATPAGLPPRIRVRGPYQGFNKKEDGHFAAHLLLAGPLAELVPLYTTLPINRAELSPAQIL